MGTNKNKNPIFTWYFGKYKKTIAYSENCIPELDIQAVFIKFSGFRKRVGSILRYSTFHFVFASIFTKEEKITGKPIGFTTEDEDEVIMEELSQKLDRHLVNLPNKVWRESTQTKYPTSPFHIVDSIRYTNVLHNEVVELVDVNINEPYSIKYRIKLLI